MSLLTLEEAKDHLQMEQDDLDSDTTLTSLLGALDRHFEGEYGVIVDRGSRSWSFDRFPSLFLIPALPIDVGTIVLTYLDASGAEQTMASVRTVAMDKWVRILPDIGTSWPTPASAPGVITVTALAGWADGDAPDDVKVAGKLLIYEWFENRDGGKASPSVDMLLEHYRLRRV